MYYCGGNALDPKLKKLGWRAGTNYECFRKGIGVGKAQPTDPGPYRPLYPKQNVYCGTSEILPRGFDVMGTPPECLKKGVGVGKMIRHEELKGNPPIPKWGGGNVDPKEIRRIPPRDRKVENIFGDRSRWEILALFVAAIAFVVFLVTGKIAWLIGSFVFFAFGGLRIAKWAGLQ